MIVIFAHHVALVDFCPSGRTILRTVNLGRMSRSIRLYATYLPFCRNSRRQPAGITRSHRINQIGVRNPGGASARISSLQTNGLGSSVMAVISTVSPTGIKLRNSRGRRSAPPMNVSTADFSFERGNARVGARKSRMEVGDVRHDGIPMRGRQDRPRSDGRTHVGRKRGVERNVSRG